MPEDDIKKYTVKFPDKYLVIDGVVINLSELKSIIYKDCEYYNKDYVNKEKRKRKC